MSEHPVRDFPSPLPRSLDLDPIVEQVRTSGGIARVKLPHGDPCWLVTGYEEVRTVYSSPCFGRPGMAEQAAPRLTAGLLLQGAIGSQEVGDHLRLRRAVLQELDADRIDSIRPRAMAVMADLLGPVEAAGTCDYVSAVAKPFAVRVLCELIGVPAAAEPALTSWVRTLLSDASAQVGGADATGTAAKELGGYIVALVRSRRADPGDDLISALVSPRHELRTRDVATIVFALVMGGFETSAHMMSKMLLRLLLRPDLRQRLRDHPELLSPVVEELLRTISIAGGEGLPWMVRDHVHLAGVAMQPGEYVIPAIGAANLDERVFASPHEVRPDRDTRQHLAFGHAAHYCLGAQMARMEFQIGLAALLERFPDIRLAISPEEIRWRSGSTVWELAELPVDVRS